MMTSAMLSFREYPPKINILINKNSYLFNSPSIGLPFSHREKVRPAGLKPTNFRLKGGQSMLPKLYLGGWPRRLITAPSDAHKIKLISCKIISWLDD